MSLPAKRFPFARPLLGLLLLLLVSEPLKAQSAGKKPPIEAQAVFSHGKEKMAAKDYSGAQTSFKQAIIPISGY